jgi:hypothetical protein
MELNLKGKVVTCVSPLTIDTLILLAVPSGPSDNQIESVLLKVGLGFKESLSVMFIVVFECVSNSIMDFRHQVVDALVRLEGDSLGELFFVAIGVLEHEPLSVGDQLAMLELSFDATHGWGEAMIAVVAFGVASFRFAAVGETSIGGAVLLWYEVRAFPVPGAVRVGPGLVGCG